ncbi:ATP phosphoribosyltransferase [Kangiella sp. TOML190]|uniref:ATP phosphoribosyltransferase n=1 Tax=Kangiella sp. TOML190 TaxID=2931351 RepID=UPI0020408E73|nr:ATP phosphoribosyltransferase [Kangiella sp. TOML190]
MTLKMVIPKGKLYDKVAELLSDIGLSLVGDSRNYRPTLYGCDIEVKLLKSQNIPELVALGQHDIGFAGLDWIEENNADVEVLENLNFNPVQVVACIPENWDFKSVMQKEIIVASEYNRIAKNYLDSLQVKYKLLRAYGATEVFPPEDADMVIDNTSTGSTIRANRLKVVGTVLQSSTQLIANKSVLKDPKKRKQIDDLLLLIRAVLNGRKRVLLEMNCNKKNIEQIVELLPAMRAPTVSELYKSDGFAIKAAVEKRLIKDLLPELIAAGATDILETPIRKVL